MKRFLHGWSLSLTLGLLAGFGSCSKDDTVTPNVSVSESSITFEAFDKEAKTFTVESNSEWTFEVSGDKQICEVTREEGSDKLTITPNVNYDNVEHTAYIAITAGTGSNTATQKVTVTQKANADTYLNILNSDLTGDNPIVTVQNSTEAGKPSEYAIRLSTNNKLTLVFSKDQGDAEAQSVELEADTRAAIEGCDWITYEVGEESTEEGTVTVLKLVCTYNADTENSRTAFLEIVSGEGTQNKVVKKRIGVTQLADKPTLVFNPAEGLTATYDQTKELTFSVAYNTEECRYTWSTGQPDWIEVKEAKKEKNVNTYTVKIKSQWSGLTERVAKMSFSGVGADGSLVDKDYTVTQTAAPKASITAKETRVVFNNGETEKFVEVECTFSEMKVTVKQAEGSEEVKWLEASYDKDLKALKLKATGTTETTRKAIVKLACGGNGNEASVDLNVTQLGTKATLILDPASVALDSKGTEQVVSVITNQKSWEIENPTAGDGFTLTADKENNKIKVSGKPLDSGSREHTYKIKAGDVTVDLKVSQRTAYKVGDLYMKNGKPVGVVYQVDAAGQHGKAYSLTVYNLIDKYFCAAFRNEGGLFKFNDSNAPLSTTDGLANQQKIMSITGWEKIFDMTKWVVDLGKEQGVDWYIPAIEELKELAEVMSGAKYTTNESGNQVLPEVSKVNAAWDKVREIYKKNATTAQGFKEDQYVVFQWGVVKDDGSLDHFIDGRKETTMQEDGTITSPGDEMAERWFSSTVEKHQGWNRSNVIMFNYFLGNGCVSKDVYAEAGSDDPVQFAGSVHPICKF